MAKDEKAQFDAVRVKYRQMGGIVRGLGVEWENFARRHRTWKTDLPNLMPGLLREEQYRNRQRSQNQFVPSMKNFSTWINGRWWTIELPDSPIEKTDTLRDAQRKRRLREDWEDYLKSKTLEELRAMWKDPKCTAPRWLIKEIAQTKQEAR